MTAARRPLAALVAVAALAATTLTGCGGGQSRIAVRVDEFAVHLDRVTTKADVAALDIDNTGRLTHHLVVIDADRPLADIPVAPSGEVDLTRLHVIDRAPAMARGRYRITVPGLHPGSYYIICTLASPGSGSHLRLGMSARLQVTRNPDLENQ